MNRQPVSPHTETVLVTGASGFIGSHLVEQLSTAGYTVIAADAHHGDRSAELCELPGVRVVELDLRDRDALEPLLARSTCVVHLAALRPVAVKARPRSAFEVNVVATYDLIELAAAHGIRRIVFGSSHSVYGAFPQSRDALIREIDHVDRSGLGMYGASKIAVEAYLEAFANQGGPEFLSLRLGTIYGPRVNRDNSLGGMMLDAVDAVRRGDRPEVSWAPEAMHDLVYVDDAAHALRRALEVRQTGVAINVVGTPIPSTVLFGTLVELVGGDPATIDWVPTQRRFQLVAHDRMNEILGAVLQTDLGTGLQNFVDWAVSTTDAA